jgi:hemolysin III
MSQSRPAKLESFSLPLFIVTVVLTLGGLLAVIAWAAPALWELQITASFGHAVVAFLSISLLLCFFEYAVHRYVLHTPVFPFLRQPYRQHTLHHALTRIGRRPTRDGRGVLVVENKFPIVEPEQGEASFFPWHTLAVYSVVHAPLFGLLQWALPQFPWFLAGFLALANSIALYEVLHAINHWSLERWEALLHHPRWGSFWQAVYGFHLRHHAVTDCNESVCGFFGLPVADWVFGTCIIPRTIYRDGEDWTAENFSPPTPRWPIRQLDAWAGRIVRRRREQGEPLAPGSDSPGSSANPPARELAGADTPR